MDYIIHGGSPCAPAYHQTPAKFLGTGNVAVRGEWSWGLRGRKGTISRAKHEMRAQAAAWAVTDYLLNSAVTVTHVRKRHGIDTH